MVLFDCKDGVTLSVEVETEGFGSNQSIVIQLSYDIGVFVVVVDIGCFIRLESHPD